MDLEEKTPSTRQKKTGVLLRCIRCQEVKAQRRRTIGFRIAAISGELIIDFIIINILLEARADTAKKHVVLEESHGLFY